MDTGEFIAVNVPNEASDIAYKELLRQLERYEEVIKHHVKMTHDAHHWQSRGGWETCLMSSCRYIQNQLGIDEKEANEETAQQSTTNN